MPLTRHTPALRYAAERLGAVNQPTIVVNPLARHASRAVTEVVRQCARLGLRTPSSFATTPAEPGRAQARQALDAGADVVVVVGGDGTIRAVARELAGTGVRLGVVALGSGNVLAHNLGLTGLDLAAQVRVGLGEVAGWLDMGWAQCRLSDGSELREPFVTMAGIGRDAEAVAHTGRHDKQRLGWLAYAVAGLRESARGPLPMRVRLDDQPWHSLKTWTVLAGNTPRVPGGVLVFPGAEADDGSLDVLEVPIEHPGQWVPVAIKGLSHHRRPVAALRHHRAKVVLVQPAGPLPVQADGDVIADVAALRLSVAERVLRVQLPAEALLGQESG